MNSIASSPDRTRCHSVDERDPIQVLRRARTPGLPVTTAIRRGQNSTCDAHCDALPSVPEGDVLKLLADTGVPPLPGAAAAVGQNRAASTDHADVARIAVGHTDEQPRARTTGCVGNHESRRIESSVPVSVGAWGVVSEEPADPGADVTAPWSEAGTWPESDDWPELEAWPEGVDAPWGRVAT